MPTEIHIGNLIREKMKENGQTASWLAQKMHCHPSNIQKIFLKHHIYTTTLLRISIILKYDFFAHYSDYLKKYKHEQLNLRPSEAIVCGAFRHSSDARDEVGVG
jgi:hypothetical protein